MGFAGQERAALCDALLEAGVSEIVLANRTAARADALADRIGDPARVHTRYWDALGELLADPPAPADTAATVASYSWDANRDQLHAHLSRLVGEMMVRAKAQSREEKV